MRLLVFFMIAALAFGCNQPDEKQAVKPAEKVPGTPFNQEEARAKYNVKNHFSAEQKDTLLANMVTFIFKKPAMATNATRTNPEFRGHFVRSIHLFEYVYHHMTDDSVHYYYLIRPARSLEGDRRGVGGRFVINNNLDLVEFEEIFNTTIKGEDELREIGFKLFEEMIATGSVDKYVADKTIIEWPDERLKYNKEMREWRYID